MKYMIEMAMIAFKLSFRALVNTMEKKFRLWIARIIS